jgi:hypothetical protein
MMSDFKADDYRLSSSRLQPPPDYGDRGQQLVPNPPAAAGVVSFLSSHEREGRWQLPRQFRALAVMGNVELDLRAAEIGYGLSVIEAVSVMGNIEITVSPEITVECDGDSLLGTFVLKYESGANPAVASRDKVIRVTGTAYCGAVTVHVKGPDESMMAKISRTMGWGQ